MVLSYSDRSNSNPVGDDETTTSPTNRSPSSSTTAAAATTTHEDPRIRQLRIDLGAGDDVPVEVLQAILDADDTNTTNESSQQSAAVPANDTSHNNDSNGNQTRGGRAWETCQAAPSRPGAFSVGDLSNNYNSSSNNDDYPIGPPLNEIELDEKRINAVHTIQSSLNARLGYDLRGTGQYEEMERLYHEGEREVNMSGLELRQHQQQLAQNNNGEITNNNSVLGPKVTIPKWDKGKLERERMRLREPVLPKPEEEEPLPLPLSFYCSGSGNNGNAAGPDHAMDDGSLTNSGTTNSEICLGKFVDPGPDKHEEEEKREESNSLDNSSNSKSSWQDVTIDDSTTIGPYDRVVRCWKCRAGLQVPLDMGLVCCPRCRTISPATDVAQIGMF